MLPTDPVPDDAASASPCAPSGPATPTPCAVCTKPDSLAPSVASPTYESPTVASPGPELESPSGFDSEPTIDPAVETVSESGSLSGSGPASPSAPRPPPPSHPMTTRAKAGIFKPRYHTDLAHLTSHGFFRRFFLLNFIAFISTSFHCIPPSLSLRLRETLNEGFNHLSPSTTCFTLFILSNLKPEVCSPFVCGKSTAHLFRYGSHRLLLRFHIRQLPPSVNASVRRCYFLHHLKTLIHLNDDFENQ
ncbi:unnamed protein product [Lactuca virosa]|uniref:Uncharacterized protein n=1 Tax=Lactuca virosa TaxID=75947 RepID=A0AAU9MXU0_9ASTR|nr:unnamed protein product [Lactuca virosa]